MKYTTEVVINAPRDKVIELLENPANFPKWQPGFVSIENISGTPGYLGAKSRLLYKMGGRKVEMIETITLRDFPDEFHCVYETKGGNMIQKNFFSTVDENKTRWFCESEVECTGLMKWIAALMPGVYKKQTQKYLNYFKEFVEKEVAQEKVES